MRIDREDVLRYVKKAGTSALRRFVCHVRKSSGWLKQVPAKDIIYMRKDDLVSVIESMPMTVEDHFIAQAAEVIFPEYIDLMEEAETPSQPRVLYAQQMVLGDDFIRSLQAEMNPLLADKIAASRTEPAKVEKIAPVATPEQEVKIHSLQQQLKEEKARSQKLIKSLARKQEEFDALAGLTDRVPEDLITGEVDYFEYGESIPIILLGDWHVGETVTSSQTSGKNQYNPDIVANRVEILTAKILDELSTHRHSIQNGFIHLQGDFIGGWIHEELIQTNSMSPMDETKFASDLLIGLIETIGERFDYLKIVATRGNHGRMTKKMQYGNDNKLNWEQLLYLDLKKRLESRNSFIDFIISESGILSTKLTEDDSSIVRCAHGHQFRYSGGIGGLAVPAAKFILRQDQNGPAGLTTVGHWHQFSSPHSRMWINGSLKGWDSYARENSFGFERPCQTIGYFDVNEEFFHGRKAIFVDR